MSVLHLALDSFWVDKFKFDDAERRHYEEHQSETPLADEVARARQRLLEMKSNVENDIVTPKDIKATQTLNQKVDSQSSSSQTAALNTKVDSSFKSTSSDFHCQTTVDSEAAKFMEKKMVDLVGLFERLKTQMDSFDDRLAAIEKRFAGTKAEVCEKPAPAACKKPEEKKEADDDDDVDLFGSDSDDEDAEKRKKEVLEAYHAKKSKKPALIAKSSIILDVKPWDDETSMKDMEVEVRKITMDGLLWGASKLVPLAFGIHKLQINCVVEDEKVSIDALQEQIEAIEDFVQSVDIAAFNKI